jgi:hypothetical protein
MRIALGMLVIAGGLYACTSAEDCGLWITQTETDDLEDEIAFGLYTSKGLEKRAHSTLLTWGRRVRHLRVYTMDDALVSNCSTSLSSAAPYAVPTVHRIRGAHCKAKNNHPCINNLIETLKQLYCKCYCSLRMCTHFTLYAYKTALHTL